MLLRSYALARNSSALRILTAGSASHCCESNLCARQERELADHCRRYHSGPEKTSGHFKGFSRRISRREEIFDSVRLNRTLREESGGAKLSVDGG